MGTTFSGEKPTNWDEIQIQDKIDSIQVIVDFLEAFQTARKTNNKDLLAFIEKLTWTWDQHRTITTKVDVDFPLISDISDDLPISDELLENTLVDMKAKVKQAEDDLYQLKKTKKPGAYENNWRERLNQPESDSR